MNYSEKRNLYVRPNQRDALYTRHVYVALY